MDKKELRKEYNRRYYLKSRNKILEQQRKYKWLNKETISAKYQKPKKIKVPKPPISPIFCECGKSLLPRNLEAHKKTKYHLTHIFS
jgi:hypothetical protein